MSRTYFFRAAPAYTGAAPAYIGAAPAYTGAAPAYTGAAPAYLSECENNTKSVEFKLNLQFKLSLAILTKIQTCYIEKESERIFTIPPF